jgi:hypothetical protein
MLSLVITKNKSISLMAQAEDFEDYPPKWLEETFTLRKSEVDESVVGPSIYQALIAEETIRKTQEDTDAEFAALLQEQEWKTPETLVFINKDQAAAIDTSTNMEELAQLRYLFELVQTR